MKRFLAEILAFVALQVLIAAGSLGYRYWRDDNFLAVSVDKTRRLATAPGPRIVFVGGSSLAFGVDSEMVQQRVGLNPVNMGLDASFGLRYLLRESKDLLRPGDVVVLSPEYDHFLIEAFGHGALSPLETWSLLFYLNPRSLRHADGDVFRRIFLTRRGLDALQNAYWQVGRDAGVVYRSSNFNSFGDLVLPDRAEVDPLPAKVYHYQPNPASVESLAEFVRRFVMECQQRGVRVLWAWPAFPRDRYLLNAPVLEQMEEVAERTIPAEVIVRGREAVLPANRFFDTVYHLNRAGRRERTELLCARLSQALSRTPRPPGAMPRALPCRPVGAQDSVPPGPAPKGRHGRARGIAPGGRGSGRTAAIAGRYSSAGGERSPGRTPPPGSPDR